MNENENITILEEPLEIDMMDWLFTHPECDSIIESEFGSNVIRVLAFSNDAESNDQLMNYRDEFLVGQEILRGMTRDGIASVI